MSWKFAEMRWRQDAGLHESSSQRWRGLKNMKSKSVVDGDGSDERLDSSRMQSHGAEDKGTIGDRIRDRSAGRPPSMSPPPPPRRQQQPPSNSSFVPLLHRPDNSCHARAYSDSSSSVSSGLYISREIGFRRQSEDFEQLLPHQPHEFLPTTAKFTAQGKQRASDWKADFDSENKRLALQGIVFELFNAHDSLPKHNIVSPEDSSLLIGEMGEWSDFREKFKRKSKRKSLEDTPPQGRSPDCWSPVSSRRLTPRLGGLGRNTPDALSLLKTPPVIPKWPTPNHPPEENEKAFSFKSGIMIDQTRMPDRYARTASARLRAMVASSEHTPRPTATTLPEVEDEAVARESGFRHPNDFIMRHRGPWVADSDRGGSPDSSSSDGLHRLARGLPPTSSRQVGISHSDAEDLLDHLEATNRPSPLLESQNYLHQNQQSGSPPSHPPPGLPSHHLPFPAPYEPSQSSPTQYGYTRSLLGISSLGAGCPVACLPEIVPRQNQVSEQNGDQDFSDSSWTPGIDFGFPRDTSGRELQLRSSPEKKSDRLEVESSEESQESSINPEKIECAFQEAEDIWVGCRKRTEKTDTADDGHVPVPRRTGVNICQSQRGLSRTVTPHAQAAPNAQHELVQNRESESRHNFSEPEPTTLAGGGYLAIRAARRAAGEDLEFNHLMARRGVASLPYDAANVPHPTRSSPLSRASQASHLSSDGFQLEDPAGLIRREIATESEWETEPNSGLESLHPAESVVLRVPTNPSLANVSSFGSLGPEQARPTTGWDPLSQTAQAPSHPPVVGTIASEIHPEEVIVGGQSAMVNGNQIKQEDDLKECRDKRQGTTSPIPSSSLAPACRPRFVPRHSPYPSGDFLPPSSLGRTHPHLLISSPPRLDLSPALKRSSLTGYEMDLSSFGRFELQGDQPSQRTRQYHPHHEINHSKKADFRQENEMEDNRSPVSEVSSIHGLYRGPYTGPYYSSDAASITSLMREISQNAPRVVNTSTKSTVLRPQGNITGSIRSTRMRGTSSGVADCSLEPLTAMRHIYQRLSDNDITQQALKWFDAGIVQERGRAKAKAVVFKGEAWNVQKDISVIPLRDGSRIGPPMVYQYPWSLAPQNSLILTQTRPIRHEYYEDAFGTLHNIPPSPELLRQAQTRLKLAASDWRRIKSPCVLFPLDQSHTELRFTIPGPLHQTPRAYRDESKVQGDGAFLEQMFCMTHQQWEFSHSHRLGGVVEDEAVVLVRRAMQIMLVGLVFVFLVVLGVTLWAVLHH